jgi:tRNA threonylcarbamoyladenosine biosynthesis protein TsaE
VDKPPPPKQCDRPTTPSPVGRSSFWRHLRCWHKVLSVSIRETSAPAETEAVGAELAGELRLGDVVLVRGELGTGKTTLVRGAARALGVSDPVTSPTFGVGHRYRGARVRVSHIDLYRLGDLEHEDPGLLDDYLGPDSIAFVEWPQDGSPELERARAQVTLTHLGGDRRRVEVYVQR